MREALGLSAVPRILLGRERERRDRDRETEREREKGRKKIGSFSLARNPHFN
jgi:hypothetical protein